MIGEDGATGSGERDSDPLPSHLVESWSKLEAAESAGREGSVLRLAFGGVEVTVSADHEAVREELVQRMGRHYTVSPVAAATDERDSHSYTVIASSFDVGLNEVLQEPSATNVSIQRHPHMQKYTRSAVFVDTRHGRLLKTEPAGAAILARPTSRSVVITHPHPRTLAKECRRLIRDLVNGHLLTTGMIEFHASGVAPRAGRVIAFVGESNSGKTTLALELVRARRAALLCNGRLFMSAGSNIQVLGPPEHILVRQGTLAGWPEFADRLPDESRKLLEQGTDRWKLDENQKITLQLEDLARVWDCHYASEGSLAAVVFCDLGHRADDSEPSLARLDSRQAERLLLSHAVKDSTWRRRLWHGMTEIWPRVGDDQSATLVRRIAEDVPVFRLGRSASLSSDVESVIQLVEGG